MPPWLSIQMPFRRCWMPVRLHRRQRHFRWPRWARPWIISNRKPFVDRFCTKNCRHHRFRRHRVPVRCCRRNRRHKPSRRRTIRHRRRAVRPAHATRIARKGKCLPAKNAAKYSTLTTIWRVTCPSIPVPDRSYARFVAKVFAKRARYVVTRSSTHRTSHINVISAARLSIVHPPWIRTHASMPATSHMSVNIAAKVSTKRAITRITNWRTAAKRHSNVVFATRHSIKCTTSRSTCTRTTTRNHILAKSAPKDFAGISIWRNTFANCMKRAFAVAFWPTIIRINTIAPDDHHHRRAAQYRPPRRPPRPRSICHRHPTTIYHHLWCPPPASDWMRMRPSLPKCFDTDTLHTRFKRNPNLF